MKVSLLTDAPKHNLALMKISAWHKAQGDEVSLNIPLWRSDKTYASVLFDCNIKRYIADIYGGPAICSDWDGIDWSIRPDYDLYQHNDFSLGYTFRHCYRGCSFCRVPGLHIPLVENGHHSIWKFHDTKFKKICMLNNNTFFDKRWKETFEEIWDANLTVVDENGYDLRLIDAEKADALKRTKWDGSKDPHFAWDSMVDEPQIIKGLEEVKMQVILMRDYGF